jgi:hypothetical protein
MPSSVSGHILMPRLNPLLQNAVVFLYERKQKTGNKKLCGTGACLGMPPEGQGTQVRLGHVYVVTNYHVIKEKETILVRVNTIGGNSRYIETASHEWQFETKRDDLAAIDVTDRLDPSDEIVSIQRDLFVTKQFIKDVELGIGEDGFMLGLFQEQHGSNRNMVAARFGNLSLLAQDDAPLGQPHGVRRPSHIFDIRSRPGFSGSPVFVYRTPAGDLRETHKGHRIKPSLYSMTTLGVGSGMSATELFSNLDAQINTFLSLLGLHAGQYNDEIDVRIRKRSGLATLSMPSSLTIVVPAWEISNLLDQKVFADQRRQRELRNQRIEGNEP